MRAKLKSLFSLEISSPLEKFWPEDEYNFGLSLRLMIGPEDDSGSESFDILVCTPDWIKSQYLEERHVWGRHMLVVLEYDFHLIKTEIERYISRCSGNDWMEVARKLGNLGAWEFEDYQE